VRDVGWAEKIRDYLQTLRIHTAPATVILLLSSYSAGGGSLFTPLGLTLLLYGILLHGSTFGHNVVMDYFWDLEDPGKQHHALVAGRIGLKAAVNLVMPLLASCLVAGLALALGNYPATAWFSAFMLFGFMYNNWFSKTSVWGWIPIVICFTSLSLYAMHLAGAANYLYAAYIMLTIWFQIAWSGYLKDIQVERQENLLRSLGVKIEDGVLVVPPLAKAFGASIKLCNMAVAALLALGAHPVNQIAVSALLAASAYMLWKLVLRSRKWNRAKELANMGFMEIATIYAGMFAVMPAAEAAVLAAFGITWYASMNKLLWGASSIPRV